MLSYKNKMWLYLHWLLDAIEEDADRGVLASWWQTLESGMATEEESIHLVRQRKKNMERAGGVLFLFN